jgi:hypothetical protein
MSALQRKILTLLHEHVARRGDLIYELYGDTRPAARASLSRTLSRLCQRGLVTKHPWGWTLTLEGHLLAQTVNKG